MVFADGEEAPLPADLGEADRSLQGKVSLDLAD